MSSSADRRLSRSATPAHKNRDGITNKPYELSINNYSLRRVLADLCRIFWSGLFRLIFGKGWLAKHKKYVKLEWAHHHLLQDLLYYYVRRIGNLAQSKLPDGIMLQPLDSISLINVNKEIYLDQVYDGFYKMREDDVVIDVGAHVGLFTLKAAKRARTVVAVEPHPFNYRLLLRNIAFNRLRNVIPVNLALSNYDGISKLYIGKDSVSHTTKKEMRSISPPCIEYLEVEVKTLDRLADELKLGKVTFIKIDVEGAELHVLKGAKRLLAGNDVFLAISAYHTSMQPYEIYRYLRRRGFTVFSFEFNKMTYIYAFKPMHACILCAGVAERDRRRSAELLT